MEILATILSFYGAANDTLSLAQFLKSRLKKSGQSAEELFADCFIRAVSRHSHKLSKLSESKDPKSVSVERAALLRAIDGIGPELEAKNLDIDRSGLIHAMCPAFRTVVIIPGHQLTDHELDVCIDEILQDAFADFFTKLPANSVATAQSLITFIARHDQSQQFVNERAEALKSAIDDLSRKQDELLKLATYLDPAVIQQESTRPEYRNPFRIVKAEDFNHDYDRLASLFREPSVYDDLRGPDNLIIAGGRGCGKSMLLRSLSALTAVELTRLKAKNRNEPLPNLWGWKESGLDYFGVYIKLARGYFYEWSPDCKLTEDAATHLFQHVFNMLLLKSLLNSLQEVRTHRSLRIDDHIERSIVAEIADFAGFELKGNTFRDLQSHARREEIKVADYLAQLRLGTTKPEYKGANTAIHDFMDHCCKSVVHAIPELSGSRIFFLLDEYENLSELQQKVVNTLAKLRPLSLSLKIASRALGVKSVVDLQGEPIQRPRDYHIVELDYGPTDAAYRELLLDIASKRLEAEKFSVTDIRKLLPEAPRYHPSNEIEILEELHSHITPSGKHFSELSKPEQSEQLHRWSVALVFRLCKDVRKPYTYAGFDDFADLSSGIISSFLEFCKLAFYLAQADGVKISSGVQIPWRTQNEAVYLASQAYFDYIERNVPDTGAAISRLIIDLSDVLREKLLNHGSEPEAGRLNIKDPGALDLKEFEHIAAILDDGVRWSVFHAMGQATAYFPKHKTDVRPDEYFLNRVLAPILRLSHRARWRCTVTTKELAGLIDQSSRGATRNFLREKHRGKPIAPYDPSNLFEQPGPE